MHYTKACLVIYGLFDLFEIYTLIVLHYSLSFVQRIISVTLIHTIIIM